MSQSSRPCWVDWLANNGIFLVTYIFISCSIGFFLFSSDIWLHVWVTVLQVCGSMTVLWDLDSAAQSLGRKSVFPDRIQVCRNKIAQFWYTFQVNRRWIVQSTAGMTLNMKTGSSVSAKGRAKITERRFRTIRQKIDILEEEVDALEKEIDAVPMLLNELHAKMQEEMDQRYNNLMSSLRRQEVTIADVAVGNARALFHGAIWVILGTVMSNFSSDVRPFFATSTAPPYILPSQVVKDYTRWLFSNTYCPELTTNRQLEMKCATFPN